MEGYLIGFRPRYLDNIYIIYIYVYTYIFKKVQYPYNEAFMKHKSER